MSTSWGLRGGTLEAFLDSGYPVTGPRSQFRPSSARTGQKCEGVRAQPAACFFLDLHGRAQTSPEPGSWADPASAASGPAIRQRGARGFRLPRAANSLLILGSVRVVLELALPHAWADERRGGPAGDPPTVHPLESPLAASVARSALLRSAQTISPHLRALRRLRPQAR